MVNYTFAQQSTEAVLDDFIAKMTQHLVPKYFSRIEKATTSNGLYYIQGYDDEDVLIFKLRTWGSNSSADKSDIPGISFYCKSTESWQTALNLCNSSSNTYINSAYVCTGGIMFKTISGNSTYYLCTMCFDSSDTVAYLNTPSETSLSSAIIISTFTQSGVLSYSVLYNDRDNISGSYYLMPFLTYNGTLKRVWWPIIKQYNATTECMRIMQLDGKDYFVMPAFLIEDF